MELALGFLAACDSACIIYGIDRFSFSLSVERSTALNNIVRIAYFAPPVPVEEISSCTRLKDARMRCTAEMNVRGKNVKERLKGARLR